MAAVRNRLNFLNSDSKFHVLVKRLLKNCKEEIPLSCNKNNVRHLLQKQCGPLRYDQDSNLFRPFSSINNNGAAKGAIHYYNEETGMIIPVLALKTLNSWLHQLISKSTNFSTYYKSSSQSLESFTGKKKLTSPISYLSYNRLKKFSKIKPFFKRAKNRTESFFKSQPVKKLVYGTFRRRRFVSNKYFTDLTCLNNFGENLSDFCCIKNNSSIYAELENYRKLSAFNIKALHRFHDEKHHDGCKMVDWAQIVYYHNMINSFNDIQKFLKNNIKVNGFILNQKPIFFSYITNSEQSTHNVNIMPDYLSKNYANILTGDFSFIPTFNPLHLASPFIHYNLHERHRKLSKLSPNFRSYPKSLILSNTDCSNDINYFTRKTTFVTSTEDENQSGGIGYKMNGTQRPILSDNNESNVELENKIYMPVNDVNSRNNHKLLDARQISNHDLSEQNDNIPAALVMSKHDKESEKDTHKADNITKETLSDKFYEKLKRDVLNDLSIQVQNLTHHRLNDVKARLNKLYGNYDSVAKNTHLLTQHPTTNVDVKESVEDEIVTQGIDVKQKDSLTNEDDELHANVQLNNSVKDWGNHYQYNISRINIQCNIDKVTPNTSFINNILESFTVFCNNCRLLNKDLSIAQSDHSISQESCNHVIKHSKEKRDNDIDCITINPANKCHEKNCRITSVENNCFDPNSVKLLVNMSPVVDYLDIKSVIHKPGSAKGCKYYRNFHTTNGVIDVETEWKTIEKFCNKQTNAVNNFLLDGSKKDTTDVHSQLFQKEENPKGNKEKYNTFGLNREWVTEIEKYWKVANGHDSKNQVNETKESCSVQPLQSKDASFIPENCLLTETNELSEKKITAELPNSNNLIMTNLDFFENDSKVEDLNYKGMHTSNERLNKDILASTDTNMVPQSNDDNSKLPNCIEDDNDRLSIKNNSYEKLNKQLAIWKQLESLRMLTNSNTTRQISPNSYQSYLTIFKNKFKHEKINGDKTKDTNTSTTIHKKFSWMKKNTDSGYSKNERDLLIDNNNDKSSREVFDSEVTNRIKGFHIYEKFDFDRSNFNVYNPISATGNIKNDQKFVLCYPDRKIKKVEVSAMTSNQKIPLITSNSFEENSVSGKGYRDYNKNQTSLINVRAKQTNYMNTLKKESTEHSWRLQNENANSKSIKHEISLRKHEGNIQKSDANNFHYLRYMFTGDTKVKFKEGFHEEQLLKYKTTDNKNKVLKLKNSKPGQKTNLNSNYYSPLKNAYSFGNVPKSVAYDVRIRVPSHSKKTNWNEELTDKTNGVLYSKPDHIKMNSFNGFKKDYYDYNKKFKLTPGNTTVQKPQHLPSIKLNMPLYKTNRQFDGEGRNEKYRNQDEQIDTIKYLQNKTRKNKLMYNTNDPAVIIINPGLPIEFNNKLVPTTKKVKSVLVNTYNSIGRKTKV